MRLSRLARSPISRLPNDAPTNSLLGLIYEPEILSDGSTKKGLRRRFRLLSSKIHRELMVLCSEPPL